MNKKENKINFETTDQEKEKIDKFVSSSTNNQDVENIKSNKEILFEAFEPAKVKEISFVSKSGKIKKAEISSIGDDHAYDFTQIKDIKDLRYLAKLKQTKEAFEKGEYFLKLFFKHDIPIVLNYNRIPIFAVTDKDVKKPLILPEKRFLKNKETGEKTEAILTFKISTINQIVKVLDEKTAEKFDKEINIGRLNNLDYKIFTVIKRHCLDPESKIFSQKVNINVFKIARSLGIKSPSGGIYKKILKSIHRLRHCSCDFNLKTEDGDEVDKGGFTFLKDYNLIRSKKNKRLEDLSYVKISDYIFSQIVKENITKLDFRHFQKLRSPIAFYLHKLLTLKKSENYEDCIVIDLPYLRWRSGYKKLRYEQVKKAAQELLDCSFLKKFDFRYIMKPLYRNELPVKNKTGDIKKIKAMQFLFWKSRNYIYDDIKKDGDKLIKLIRKHCHVNYSVAKNISNMTQNFWVIIKKLKLMLYIDEIKKSGSIKNRPAWLRYAVTNNIKGDKEFEEAWKENYANDIIKLNDYDD